MIQILGQTLGDQGITWNMKEYADDKGTEVEVVISIHFLGRLPLRGVVKELEQRLQESKVTWLKREGKQWNLDLNSLRSSFKELEKVGFLEGSILLEPDLFHEDNPTFVGTWTELSFSLTEEEINLNKPKRVFLSHSGKDKPLVRSFKTTLETLGFEPWLDEDVLPAGKELHRGLKEGLRDSCAAIFFITPNFKDKGYLRNEVNDAVEEKRVKEDRFAIITLVLDGADPENVPDLLKRYVYKSPKEPLEALREIVKALPVKIGSVGFEGYTN